MSTATVRIELHCHSSLSDGAVPPEELAAAIAGAGVSFASLTDHDTVEGCARFRDALAGTGVACIDGVEITTVTGQWEIHLLGYGVDPSNEGLRAALSANRLGVDPGLPGLVDSMKRMRSRSRHADAAPIATVEAIALLHAAGGKAFIAHPLSSPLGREALAELLPGLEAAGLDGIEAIYAPYPDEDRRWLADLAEKHHLAMSGGSDFHGPELVAGPAPGVEMSAGQWKAFRDLLLPGHRHPVRSRSAVDSRRSAPGRFAMRIVLPAAAAVAMFVIALFVIAIPRFESVLLERKKDMIRELANEATSILREYAAEERAGRLSAEDARRGAAARVRDLRYGPEGKDYFWITDMQPVMIVHPYRHELEGTDVSEYRDANGVQVFVEFVDAVRDRNQGYVEYLWQWKDDAHRIVPKLSFVERFPDWDWVVGTGIYLDDVQAEIARMARWMIWLSLGITAALALILAFVVHQSLAVERARKTAETRLRESHERYRALVEASTEGMVLLVDGAFTYANRSFLDMTGYSASQLPLIGVTELICAHEGEERSLSRFLEALVPDAAPDAPAPPPLACLLARRDGEGVDAVLTASPFAVAGRKGWILAAKPVTGSRSEEQLPGFAGTLPIGMFRAAWGRHVRLIDVNDAGRKALEAAGAASESDLSALLVKELADGDRLERRMMETIGPTGDPRRMLVSAYLGPVQPDGERYVDGIIEDVTAVLKADGLFDDLVGQFHRAKSIADIRAARSRLIELASSLLESGADLRQINRRYTVLSDIALERLIGLAVEQLGDPPASFVFLALGSEGRSEQTPGSDQDNAIVYADGAPGDPAVVHAWFHSLGTTVCGWLAEMGVSPCKGEMMASNPRWCAPISEWESMFGRWIAEPEPRELLDFQVFFDFRAVYGDGSLADGLRACIVAKLAGEPPFFLHLARDALQRRLPQVLYGGFSRDAAGSGEADRNFKEVQVPFVSFARLYALRHGIVATNTLARLEALRSLGVLKQPFFLDVAAAYAFLAETRLRHQVRWLPSSGMQTLPRGAERWSQPDGAQLRHASEQAALLQKRISFDFLGSAL